MKSLSIQTKTGMNMSRDMKIEERAENLGYSELTGITNLNFALYSLLDDYLSPTNTYQRPLLLLGTKGSGKTVHVLKVLSKLVSTHDDFSPAMYIYRMSHKIEPLDPMKIAEREVWGKRLDNLSGEQAIENADAIILDDFHYVCEDVIKSNYPVENLVNFMSNLADKTKKGKKVLLISEAQSGYYADFIDNKEFDDVLLRFGEERIGDIFKKKKFTYEDFASPKRDVVARQMVPMLSYENWSEIIKQFPVRPERDVAEMIHSMSTNIRFFIKFAKLFSKDSVIKMRYITKEIYGGKKLYNDYKSLKQKIKSWSEKSSKVKMEQNTPKPRSSESTEEYFAREHNLENKWGKIMAKIRKLDGDRDDVLNKIARSVLTEFRDQLFEY